MLRNYSSLFHDSMRKIGSHNGVSVARMVIGTIIFIFCFILGCQKAPVAASRVSSSDQLFDAIWRYDTNRVAALLGTGVSANSIARSVARETALIDAVRFGHAEIVQMLLDKGADPNLPDRAGYGALFHALSSPHLSGHPDNIGSEDLLATLLTCGADIRGKGVIDALKNIPLGDPRFKICQDVLGKANANK